MNVEVDASVVLVTAPTKLAEAQNNAVSKTELSRMSVS